MEMALSWLAVSAGAVALMWLKLHYQRLNLTSRAPDLERLENRLEHLADDLDALDAEVRRSVDQLNERVDFAERVLTRPADRLDESLSESTPV